MTLSVSTPAQEGAYQGSKWLKLPILSDPQELESLFQKLDSVWMFPLSKIGDGKAIPTDFFLREYGRWIAKLKAGEVPTSEELRHFLAAALTDDLTALWLQEIPKKGYLVKVRKPVVQMQAHFFSYSPVDGAFRSMSLGGTSIFWGLQFAYPQIYQDGQTMEFVEEKKSPLFEQVRRWAREESRPTPFCVRGEKVNAPMRLGKKCFFWIERHPQLIAQGIHIDAN